MTEPATAFVHQLFQELERVGIEHVVARRADLLPHPPAGDDIDVVVRRTELRRAAALLAEVAAKLGGTCFSADRFLGSAQYLFSFPDENDGLRVVHLHLQDSISHRGLELAPGDAMLEGRRRRGDYWRPRPGMEEASLLLHDVVAKAALRASDVDQLRELFDREPRALLSAVDRLAGPGFTRKVEAALGNGNEPNALAGLKPGLLLRGFLRRPFGMLQWWAVHLLRSASYLFRRRGALIVLVGPDGSGKTTLAEAIGRLLGSCGRKAERFYFGLTAPLLPTKRIMKLFHSRRRGGIERKNDHVPRNPTFKSNLIYFLGTCHSLLDQWLRYWLQARPRLARSRILLFDRYFYDSLTSPAPRGLKRLLDWAVVRLTPRPDLTFVLMDSPSAINARKPELAVDEIDRQQCSFRTLLEPPVRGREVRIEVDPTPNARAMAREILTAFGARNV